MSRFGAILAAALALSPGISGSGQGGAADLGERQTDPASGYTIRGPAGWDVQRGTMEGVSLVFLGPAHEGFFANLNVVVLPEIIEVTPRYVERLARDLEAEVRGRDGTGAGAGYPGPDYRVTRRRVAPVGGTDAAYLEAAYTRTGPAGAKRFRQLQVHMPGPGEYYVLTYTAREEAFEASLPAIRAAVNSFTPGLPPAEDEALPPWHGWPAARVLIGALAVLLLGLALRRRRAR